MEGDKICKIGGGRHIIGRWRKGGGIESKTRKAS